MAVSKTELHKVITKLDDVRVELLRLRADLLPEVRPTASEKRQIALGRREIERGGFVTLAQLRKEIGAWPSVLHRHMKPYERVAEKTPSSKHGEQSPHLKS